MNQSDFAGRKSNLPQIILATRNAHKTTELHELLAPDFVVTDLSAYPAIPVIAETGASFEQNASLKAIAASKELPGLIAADDSGLEVDALNGAPGVYSARYAGENATDQRNIDKLLGELRATVVRADARFARFRCVIALASAGKLVGKFEGVVHGKIVDPPRGRRGFGYDPVFQPDGFARTFAQMPAELKNRISHRGRAAERLHQFLKTTPQEVRM